MAPPAGRESLQTKDNGAGFHKEISGDGLARDIETDSSSLTTACQDVSHQVMCHMTPGDASHDTSKLDVVEGSTKDGQTGPWEKNVTDAPSVDLCHLSVSCEPCESNEESPSSNTT